MLPKHVHARVLCLAVMLQTRIKRAAQNKANQLKRDELNGLAQKTRDFARDIKVICNLTNPPN